ncbi:hypothetical protein [Paraburkholderia terrae]
MTLANRLYATSGAFSLAAFGLRSLTPPSNVFAPFLYALAVCTLTVAFFQRFRSLFTTAWRNQFVRWLIVIYGAIATVVATVPAKHIIADAMGLPAIDFASTLALWTLLCAPELWLFGAALIPLAAYAGLLCSVAIETVVLTTAVGAPIRALMRLHPRVRIWLADRQERRLPLTLQTMADSAAAAALAIVLGASVNIAYNVVNQPTLVRLFAFFADYGSARDYPGVEAGEPFLLHANDVVSYVERRGYEVKIRVGHLKETPSEGR